ncbi:hypothetical protein BD626DRAFT_519351 [Schizophyllum amplum]|uniref:Uncharacterized protein n=1 Tax=Schizophyllum amplum TaxID=97359 RepID=A0A550BVA5_9AGAR|nr:hypothetical protein BD626DRAFT_519351 [Auriculariopsis ampla]
MSSSLPRRPRSVSVHAQRTGGSDGHATIERCMSPDSVRPRKAYVLITTRPPKRARTAAADITAETCYDSDDSSSSVGDGGGSDYVPCESDDSDGDGEWVPPPRKRKGPYGPPCTPARRGRTKGGEANADPAPPAAVLATHLLSNFGQPKSAFGHVTAPRAPAEEGGRIRPSAPFELEDVFQRAGELGDDTGSLHSVESRAPSPEPRSEPRRMPSVFDAIPKLATYWVGNYVAQQTLVPNRGHIVHTPLMRIPGPPTATRNHRNAVRAVLRASNGGVKAIASRKARQSEVDVVRSTHSLPLGVMTSTGWTARTQVGAGDLGAAHLKLRLIPWNGRDTLTLTDDARRLVVKCVGHPDDANWQSDVLDEVGARMAMMASLVKVPQKSAQDRRGNLGAINFGIAFGRGQQEPGNLRVDPHNDAIIRAAIREPCFERLTGHCDSVMKAGWQGMHDLYEYTLDHLLAECPWLLRNFKHSVMACSTFNFGPRSVSNPHRDTQNLAFGLCMVHAQGKYNPDYYGQLALWDLGVAIRFPPGATIIFPSALITHSNGAIGPNDVRYSFTQYFSGHLFRWVYNGGRTDKVAQAGYTQLDWVTYEGDKERRRRFGAAMFPVVS